MTIAFTQIPQNLRVPLFFLELDNSRANAAQDVQRSLAIGQITAAGTLTAGVPVRAEGTAWARAAAGPGSMLALVVEAYRRRDSFGELWVLPVADHGSGVAATGTIVFTAQATANGTLTLYVAGRRVQMPVTPSLTPAQLATKLAAAINADTTLPVTASVASATVTVTAKNKGAAGNEITLLLNYRGAAGGESTPAGLTLTITPMANGTTNPALDAALASLGDMTFDFIVMPYTDSTNLDAFRDFQATRWAWDKMLYGGGFGGYRGTLGAVTAFGLGRNDPHISVMPFDSAPDPAWIWAANIAGAAAPSLRADPGLPLHTLALDVLPPPPDKRWDIGERNSLLYSGLSSFTVGDDGQVRLETVVTTYQKNDQGEPDDSYLYVERLYTLAYGIRYLKNRCTSTWGRFKLADDGTQFRPGARIVTPTLIRDGILGFYRELVRDGFAQDYDQFAAALVVERNSQNRCRVDGLLPIVPIDQLRQLCMLAQFRNSVG